MSDELYPIYRIPYGSDDIRPVAIVSGRNPAEAGMILRDELVRRESRELIYTIWQNHAEDTGVRTDNEFVFALTSNQDEMLNQPLRINIVMYQPEYNMYRIRYETSCQGSASSGVEAIVSGKNQKMAGETLRNKLTQKYGKDFIQQIWWENAEMIIGKPKVNKEMVFTLTADVNEQEH